MGQSRWALWGAVQATISTIDVDFAGVTAAFWNDAVALLDGEDFPGLLRDASAALVTILVPSNLVPSYLIIRVKSRALT